MKVMLPESTAFNNSMIKKLFAPGQQSKIVSTARFLTMLIFIFSVSAGAQAQTTYNFSAASFNAATKGYEMPGVGTYFKDNGSSSGNISPNNSVNCFGYSPGYPTSGNQFYFLPVIGNISKIIVKGNGTGSNRVFASIGTSATQNGTYTIDGGAVGTGTISGTTCGTIEIVPSALLNSGTYLQIKFSGNMNVSSIDFFNNATTPTVTTAASTNVSCTSFTVNGSIDNDGGFSLVTRGFVYSTTNNPPSLSDNVITDAAQGTGSFTADLSSLPQGTTYYVSAYGTNTVGTTYGAVQTVTTATPSAPILTTTATANVTSFGAQTGGNITGGGCAEVTARGVVWSTSPNPTVPSVNSTTDGSGAGSFSSQILGLTASTTYYVRAYAINSNGTGYGNEISFTTDVPQPSLFSSVSALNFPATAIGSSSSLTYTLTGENLSANGTVTITVPAGFTVSPASVNYTGSSFAQVVTVTFSPTQFTSFSGAVTQSGGGASGAYNISPLVSGNGKLPTPAVTSNVGNDFWLGFGYHSAMDQKDADEAHLSIYLSSADKDAEVVVEMPGLNGSFVTQTIPVPKGTVQEVSGFPTGDNNKFNPTNQPDSRLYYTGLSNRAIHVYSKDGTPVSAWMYTYSQDNSAAGSMIFPTNTWNTSYAVQAYGNNTNSGIPNSFFFVIADQDNTTIEFVPSVDILDSATGNLLTSTPTGAVKYFAGQTYQVTLNRGQVFNAMSSLAGKFGLDLSGTTVKSLDCTKKIAVFGGNGRVLVDVNIPQQTTSRTGSDNLIQQMFPKVAWGTKYYTAPTKHMEYNLFRINVDDPATQVWVNDTAHLTPLTGLLNGYYEYQTNVPSLIESDKPISVTQFIAAQAYATGKVGFGNPSDYGMNGIGDPEMIILSPAQQAISKVTVFSPSFKNNKLPAGAYINVVIKKDGLNSFRLDPETNIDQMVDTGSSSYTGIPFDPAPALIPIKDAFQPYTLDSNYYWAKFRVNFPEAHTLQSNVPFNAIAYGTDDGESYGFNAGTKLNDLSTPLIIENPYGGPRQQLSTCRGTDFKVSAVLPYETNKITFAFGANTPVLPATDTTLQVSTGYLPHDSTFVVNGQTFYVYRLARTYSFTDVGTYAVNVTAFDNNTTDVCAVGTDKTITYNIDVVAGLNAQFDIAYDKCINDSVILTDKSDGLGHEVISWKWTYDNNAKALAEPEGSQQNPRIVNPADNTAKSYTLLAVNDIGCFNSLTKALPESPLPDITFTAPTPNPVCSNAQAITLVATPAGGVFSGPGVTTNQFNPATAGAGTHTLKYTYTVGVTCSGFKEQTIVVNPSATLSITAVNPLCITDNAVTLQGTPAGGTFSGPGVVEGSFDPETAGAGSHTITYTNGPCAAPVTTVIKVNNIPFANAGPDVTTPLRTAVTIQATGTAEATYTWSPSEWLSSATVLSPTVTPTQTGVFPYTLTVSLGGNCTATDEVIVNATGPCVDPPSAFTPNNDGFNDKWIVSNGACAQQVKVDVYNRWGGRVFSSSNYKNDWTGTHGGKVVPDGTYYYVIQATLTGGAQLYFKGNVTIMR